MAHSVDEHVGRRFREFRKARGLSQSAVGEGLGLTFQQVQKYERGANRISASKLYEAAHLFGVRIDSFFDGLVMTEDNTFKSDEMALVLSTDPKATTLLRAFAKAPEKTRKKILDLVEVIVGED